MISNKIIQTTDFSISCPFTSTALIAKSLNRPCIYYDTTGLVDTDDPAAHNVEIINSFDKLDDFFLFFIKVKYLLNQKDYIQCLMIRDFLTKTDFFS